MFWPPRTRLLPSSLKSFSGPKTFFLFCIPPITMFHGFHIIHLILLPEKKSNFDVEIEPITAMDTLMRFKSKLKSRITCWQRARVKIFVDQCLPKLFWSLHNCFPACFRALYRDWWRLARTRAYKLMSSVSSHRYGSFKAPFHVWMICNKHGTLARFAFVVASHLQQLSGWLGGRRPI